MMVEATYVTMTPNQDGNTMDFARLRSIAIEELMGYSVTQRIDQFNGNSVSDNYKHKQLKQEDGFTFKSTENNSSTLSKETSSKSGLSEESDEKMSAIGLEDVRLKCERRRQEDVKQLSDKNVHSNGVTSSENCNVVFSANDVRSVTESRYRGVAVHRLTGRWEAHIWQNGKQLYLGSFANEKAAATAYDKAAIKLNRSTNVLNFPIQNYTADLDHLASVTKDELIIELRRESAGFARGTSHYRGVSWRASTKRYEARIGRLMGKKYTYLGTFTSGEAAARAYDLAAIISRGREAITNFHLSEYEDKLKEVEAATPEQRRAMEQEIATRNNITVNAGATRRKIRASPQSKSKHISLKETATRPMILKSVKTKTFKRVKSAPPKSIDIGDDHPECKVQQRALPVLHNEHKKMSFNDESVHDDITSKSVKSEALHKSRPKKKSLRRVKSTSLLHDTDESLYRKQMELKNLSEMSWLSDQFWQGNVGMDVIDNSDRSSHGNLGDIEFEFADSNQHLLNVGISKGEHFPLSQLKPERNHHVIEEKVPCRTNDNVQSMKNLSELSQADIDVEDVWLQNLENKLFQMQMDVEMRELSRGFKSTSNQHSLRERENLLTQVPLAGINDTVEINKALVAFPLKDSKSIASCLDTGQLNGGYMAHTKFLEDIASTFDDLDRLHLYDYQVI